MLSKKSPLIAAVAPFLLGPLGYFYLGWRYGVLAPIALAVFTTLLDLGGSFLLGVDLIDRGHGFPCFVPSRRKLGELPHRGTS
jgi:hypothetical protein